MDFCHGLLGSESEGGPVACGMGLAFSSGFALTLHHLRLLRPALGDPGDPTEGIPTTICAGSDQTPALSLCSLTPVAAEQAAPSSPSGLRLPDRAALSPAMGVEMPLLRRMRRMRKAGAASHTDNTPNPSHTRRRRLGRAAPQFRTCEGLKSQTQQ